MRHAIPRVGLLAAIAALMPTGRGRNRAAGRRTAIAHLVNAPTRKTRLRIARGAGTISAKADINQLARAGRWREAAQMAVDHRRQCGETIIPDDLLEQWRSRAA